MRPICTLRFVGIIILTALSLSISGKPEKKETITDGNFTVIKLATSESGN